VVAGGAGAAVGGGRRGRARPGLPEPKRAAPAVCANLAKGTWSETRACPKPGRLGACVMHDNLAHTHSYDRGGRPFTSASAASACRDAGGTRAPAR
jgi:hypothetical protein